MKSKIITIMLTVCVTAIIFLVAMLYSGVFGVDYRHEINVTALLCLASLSSFSGSVPRRVFLKKRKLYGSRRKAFETLRAGAVALPVLLIAGVSMPSIAMFIVVFTAALLMRAIATGLLVMRRDARFSEFNTAGLEAKIMRLKNANSRFIALVCVCALIWPVLHRFLGVEIAPMSFTILGLIASSVIIFMVSEVLIRQEAQMQSGEKIEIYMRHCIENNISDLIHYAGGDIKSVCKIAETIKHAGMDVVVISRDLRSHERATKAGLRSFLVIDISELDGYAAFIMRRVHYPSNTLRAGHMIRFSHLKHILHLGSLPCPNGTFPKHLAMYDMIVARLNTDVIPDANRLGVVLVDRSRADMTSINASLLLPKRGSCDAF